MSQSLERICYSHSQRYSLQHKGPYESRKLDAMSSSYDEKDLERQPLLTDYQSSDHVSQYTSESRYADDEASESSSLERSGISIGTSQSHVANRCSKHTGTVYLNTYRGRRSRAPDSLVDALDFGDMLASLSGSTDGLSHNSSISLLDTVGDVVFRHGNLCMCYTTGRQHGPMECRRCGSDPTELPDDAQFLLATDRRRLAKML